MGGLLTPPPGSISDFRCARGGLVPSSMVTFLNDKSLENFCGFSAVTSPPPPPFSVSRFARLESAGDGCAPGCVRDLKHVRQAFLPFFFFRQPSSASLGWRPVRD